MIVREQFTAYDWWLHPECSGEEYLDYVKKGNDIISYGFKKIDGAHYKWITKEEANADSSV